MRRLESRARSHARPPVEWLNYQHLLYFYTVAKEAASRAAAAHAALAQLTLSGQIRKLEEASTRSSSSARAPSGAHRDGTGCLRLTRRRSSRSAATSPRRCADGHRTARRLSIGVADVVPKLITHRLLEVALALPNPVQIVCHEGKSERLIADLAVHGYDLVITDAPLPPHLNVKAYNHRSASVP